MPLLESDDEEDDVDQKLLRVANPNALPAIPEENEVDLLTVKLNVHRDVLNKKVSTFSNITSACATNVKSSVTLTKECTT